MKNGPEKNFTKKMLPQSSRGGGDKPLVATFLGKNFFSQVDKKRTLFFCGFSKQVFILVTSTRSTSGVHGEDFFLSVNLTKN